MEVSPTLFQACSRLSSATALFWCAQLALAGMPRKPSAAASNGQGKKRKRTAKLTFPSTDFSTGKAPSTLATPDFWEGAKRVRVSCQTTSRLASQHG
jgi:hypothetical protein